MLPRSGWPSQTVALNGTASLFGSKLPNVDERSADRWLFVAYDQLNNALFEPAQPHEGTLGLVFIESMEKANDDRTISKNWRSSLPTCVILHWKWLRTTPCCTSQPTARTAKR